MANIELVIKIPEELKEALDNAKKENAFDYIQVYNDTIYNAIKNGISLPKGHGKIGDLDELIQAMKERNDDNGGEPLNMVDRGYDLAYQHMVEEAKECVIIEADSEVKE